MHGRNHVNLPVRCGVAAFVVAADERNEWHQLPGACQDAFGVGVQGTCSHSSTGVPRPWDV
jgi:hypothetical protein